AAATAIFYVFARYRFTLVPIALLFAGAPLGRLPEFVAVVRNHTWFRTWGPGLLLAALAGLACNYPLAIANEEALTYTNLAMGLFTDGHPVEAIPPLQKAVKIKPSLAGAYHNLGRVYLALKQPTEAIAQFELALRHNPNFGVAHAELG